MKMFQRKGNLSWDLKARRDKSKKRLGGMEKDIDEKEIIAWLRNWRKCLYLRREVWYVLYTQWIAFEEISRKTLTRYDCIWSQGWVKIIRMWSKDFLMGTGVGIFNGSRLTCKMQRNASMWSMFRKLTEDLVI